MFDFKVTYYKEGYTVNIQSDCSFEGDFIAHGWNIKPSSKFKINPKLKLVLLPQKIDDSFYLSNTIITETEVFELVEALKEYKLVLTQKVPEPKTLDLPEPKPKDLVLDQPKSPSGMIHFNHFGIDPNQVISYVFCLDGDRLENVVRFHLKTGHYIQAGYDPEEKEKIRSLF